MATTQVIAIDGRPASPAMAAALAKIAADGAASRIAADARKARIDADPRIIARRAQLAALPEVDGIAAMFSQFADGTVQRHAILSRLIRARIELVEGFPHHARRILKGVAVARRQSSVVVA